MAASFRQSGALIYLTFIQLSFEGRKEAGRTGHKGRKTPL